MMSIHFCICNLAAVWLIGAQAWAAPGGAIVPNPETPGTLTCGIQEAIDSLPEAGGIVYLPVGVYTVQTPIRMKPNTTLTGAGDGSVIRKDAGRIVYLAQDINQGEEPDYVTVQNAGALRPGMIVVVGNHMGLLDLRVSHGDYIRRRRAGSEGVIERIDGNKVYLRKARRGRPENTPWQAVDNLRVAEQAAVYNAFALVLMSRRCVLSNLAVDGNREGQAIQGEKLYTQYPLWQGRLRCVPYVGGDSRIENCRIYNSATVAVSLGYRATVVGCDIFGSYQGLHLGAGPYSQVIRNTIHHNEDCGIYMCMGNYGVIISQNHIYANQSSGIGGLGIVPKTGRSGDHFCIISDNVIYRNGEAGICSTQDGPDDLVITGNIIMNNWQNPRLVPWYHKIPAGIVLFNARRCLISNNRCMDDQDWYPVELAGPVEAGAVRVGPLVRHAGKEQPMFIEPQYYDRPAQKTAQNYGYTNFLARIEGGGNAEDIQVSLWTSHTNLVLSSPLQYAYPAGSIIKPKKTQYWGIFVGGPTAAENLVANNICLGNAAGGILEGGANQAAHGNIGSVVELGSVFEQPDLAA